MTAKRLEAEYIATGRYIVAVMRSARKKTATIKVESGLVSICAPRSTPIKKLATVLAAKRKWIIDKLAIHQEAQPPSERQYISGEGIPYLGWNYRLQVIKGPYQKAKLLNGRLVV
ncbi:YgjP-like metallopeptidase domain-containing protein [Reinekea sp.]|uniref:YgjP-like metallopeptidase domain-containing protein n=1 Tax=Reinekea sp. TaxID=1970455 RepID=UPI002A7F01E0|nr:YgjP-like metallopeptidase domain-containing protein [Reinekea sp.]